MDLYVELVEACCSLRVATVRLNDATEMTVMMMMLTMDMEVQSVNPVDKLTRRFLVHHLKHSGDLPGMSRVVFFEVNKTYQQKINEKCSRDY